MAQAASNSIDVDLFQQITAQDSEIQSTAKPASSPSSAFVRKCLHPPSAIPNFEGMPTNDARTQVTVEWRGIDLLNPPATLIGGVVSPVGFFDEYALLIPNGGRVKYLGFVKHPDTGVWDQDLSNVGITDTYNWNNWISDANLYRVCYKSTTTYLNATMFNNVGMVSSCQFNPSILFSGTILSMIKTQPDLFRRCVKTLMKDGHVRIEKFSKGDDSFEFHWVDLPLHIRADLVDMLGLKKDEYLQLDPNTGFQMINFGNSGDTTLGADSFIPSLSQIMQQSQRSYTGKAFEGTFNVQRLNTISPEWLSATNTNGGAGVPINKGLYNCNTYWFDSGFVPHQITLSDAAPIGTLTAAVPILKDTLWTKDMTWSWIHYKGLQLNTAGTGGIQSEILAIKTYTGLEIQPTNRSAWAGMMKVSPRPDLAAMQLMMDGFYELKDSMPAKYNFWGTIGKVALKGLKLVGSTLLKEITNEVTERQSNGNKEVKRDKKGNVVKKLQQEVQKLNVKENNTNKQLQQVANKVQTKKKRVRKPKNKKKKPFDGGDQG